MMKSLIMELCAYLMRYLKTNNKLIDGTPKHTSVQNLKKIRHLHLCFFVLTVGRTDERTDGRTDGQTDGRTDSAIP